MPIARTRRPLRIALSLNFMDDTLGLAGTRPTTRIELICQGITMLVLSRKAGERILIGDQVVVTIVRVAPNGVRIGIEAPPEMVVVREELSTEPGAEQAGQPTTSTKPR